MYETHIDLGEAERAAINIKSMLLKLRGDYDLAPLEYTRKVRIAPGEIPRSHPVLTLNTMARDEHALLSVYLHEQMHWYVTWCSHRNGVGWRAIWSDLRTRFSDVPVAFPEGAHTVQSSYLHLIVNIYKIVLAHWDALSSLYREHALVPFRPAAAMTGEDLSLAAQALPR